MKTIKLTVAEDVTSCAQLRVKTIGCDYTVFECGIDLVGHLWVANYPHVYGHNLKDLVENILEWHELAKPNRLDRIESLHICDDTQALTCTYDSMEEYYEAFDAALKKTSEEFSKVKDKALRGLTYNPETKEYEGIVEVAESSDF